jgi:tRNA pseudouridine13 synthase
MSSDEALAEIENTKLQLNQRLGEGRFPNFVGPQRFGAGRPVTAAVGRHLLKGDIEGAVSTYIGFAGEGEQQEAAEFRRHWRENHDPDSALEIVPPHLGWEKDMLQHLSNNPDDYLGAFAKIPRSLQLLTIHALQSLVFNHHLQKRMDADIPLNTPINGDMVGPLDESGSLDIGRMVKATDSTLPRIERNCQLGRLVPTGILPGTETVDAGKFETDALEILELSDCDWKVEQIPRLTSKGTHRPLVATFSEFVVDTVAIADDSTLNERWQEGPTKGSRWHPEGACIRFRFILPSGTYATTLLREFMRSPLLQM